MVNFPCGYKYVIPAGLRITDFNLKSPNPMSRTGQNIYSQGPTKDHKSRRDGIFKFNEWRSASWFYPIFNTKQERTRLKLCEWIRTYIEKCPNLRVRINPHLQVFGFQRVFRLKQMGLRLNDDTERSLIFDCNYLWELKSVKLLSYYMAIDYFQSKLNTVLWNQLINGRFHYENPEIRLLHWQKCLEVIEKGVQKSYFCNF